MRGVKSSHVLTDEQRSMVEKNWPLARAYANRTKPHHPHFDDIVSEATRGIAKATESYDPKISKFSTYATYWMWSYVKTYLDRTDSIPVPRRLKHGGKLKQADRDGCGRDAARTMGLKREDPEALGEVCSRSSPSPLDAMIEHEDLVWLDNQIDAMDERSRVVVRRRLEGDSLSAIGRDLGLTKQRVQQIEKQAIEAIREAAAKRKGVTA